MDIKDPLFNDNNDWDEGCRIIDKLDSRLKYDTNEYNGVYTI